MLMLMLPHCFLCEIRCLRCALPTNWLQFYYYSGFCSFLDASKISKNEKLLHVIIFALLTLCMQVANAKWKMVYVSKWRVYASATERVFEVVERTNERWSTWTEVLIKQEASTSNHHRIFHVLCAMCIHRKPYLLIHNLFAFVPILQMEHARHTHTPKPFVVHGHIYVDFLGDWFNTAESFIFEHSTILLVCLCCVHTLQLSTAPNAMLAQFTTMLYYVIK